MKMVKTAILLMSLSVAPIIQAKSIKIEKGGAVYSINIPDNFDFYPTFMGLENVIMAPAEGALGTPSLSITITGIKDAKLNSKELSSSQKEYQEGRSDFIKKRNLSLVEFIPYALKKSPQGHQIHTVGVIYSNGERVTVDRSFMIECPQSFIHAKFLGHVGLMKDAATLKKNSYKSASQTEFEKAVLSLTCKN